MTTRKNLNKTKCGMETFFICGLCRKQAAVLQQSNIWINQEKTGPEILYEFFFRPKYKKTGKQIAESFRSPVSSILTFHFKSKPSIKFRFTGKIDSSHVLRGKFSYWRLWFDFCFVFGELFKDLLPTICLRFGIISNDRSISLLVEDETQ